APWGATRRSESTRWRKPSSAIRAPRPSRPTRAATRPRTAPPRRRSSFSTPRRAASDVLRARRRSSDARARGRRSRVARARDSTASRSHRTARRVARGACSLGGVNVPKWLPWVGHATVAVAIAAYLFPKLARSYGLTPALSRCAELQAQRAQRALHGTDPVTLARRDSEVRACSQTAQSLGAELDLGDVTLEACVAKLEQINQEWAHYRSTEYSDAVKRNNTRSAMLRFGEEAARCASGAVEDA